MSRPPVTAFEKEPPPGEVAVGRVLGAWGIQGHMKVEPMTDFADRFSAGNTLTLGGIPRQVLDVKERKRQLVVLLKGIETPEDASALRGTLLTIPEAELSPLGEDEYYRFQLIGLAVQDEEGSVVGKVTEILDTGETQVLVVESDVGETLIPLVEGFVIAVDLAGGKISADLTGLHG
ncbi:MAG TPA: ribosome maturation factor RimM [Dehalococcoidia bacterium]|nr:ribosome maturation factor RimM [Dehalococcoidia bacterium]